MLSPTTGPSDKAKGRPVNLSFNYVVDQQDADEIGTLPEMSLKLLPDLKQASDFEVSTEVVERLNLTAHEYESKAREEGSSPNFKAIMYMIMPLEAHMRDGTKKQKSSYTSYWGTFCAAYDIDLAGFANLSSEEVTISEKRK